MSTLTSTTTSTTEHVLSPRAESWLAAVGAGLGVVQVGWTSTVKPAAKHKAHTLTKTVTATVLTGAKYSELAVNDGRQTGDLPWGQWARYPHVVVHNDREYARIYPVDGTLRATYFVDGAMVSREDFLALLTPSAAAAAPPNGSCITVKMENVTIL